MSRSQGNLSWVADIGYRWIYVGLGSMTCVPVYFSVWSWWGQITVFLLLVSLILYFTVERPKKTRLYMVLGLAAGAWIDTLIASLFGRVDNEDFALLLTASIISIILAASSDNKK
jgi:hypothetical protein